jgi:uncharacterized protein (TIGR04255 family)
MVAHWATRLGTNVSIEAFPKYESPPVVEVVCGVLFAPIPAFTLPYLGRFWSHLPSDFTETAEVDPLAPAIELLGDQHTPLTLDVSVLRVPRVWFINQTGDQVVQIQRDRFLCNWRRVAPEHAYPSFDWVKERFHERLSVFQDFVRTSFAAVPAIRQYELNYINHIPAEAWGAMSAIGHVLPDIAWRSHERFLPSPERLEAQFSFLLPGGAGRLHARIQNALRQVDRAPVLVLEMTARGFLEDRESWFALAHEWIVRGFADLTGSEVQEGLWRRKH